MQNRKYTDDRFVCINNNITLALVVQNLIREREREKERQRERKRERERKMSNYMLHYLHVCCMYVHYRRP